jgi:5-methyltetrahydropteroyltriglutamate--homocysteine methyltransferase
MPNGTIFSSQLLLASAGSYARSGDSPPLKFLEETIAAAERGERSIADVVDAQDEVTRLAVSDQIRAGLDVFTDGHIRWLDPISHLAGKMEGVQPGETIDYLRSGTKVWQPVLQKLPTRTIPLVVEEYLFMRNALGTLATPAGKAGRLYVKAVLTGPYTLARFTAVEESMEASDQIIDARANAYAQAIGEEIEALAAAGAELIQIDEPAILDSPRDWSLLQDLFDVIAEHHEAAKKSGKHVELVLSVFYRDCTPFFDELIEMPVDAIALDFPSSPGLADHIVNAGSPKPLVLGIVNGTKADLENPADLARQVERILPKIEGQRAHLSTSCGLSVLSQKQALSKLELLAKTRSELQGH